MATTSAFLKIEEQHAIAVLQEAGVKLEKTEAEAILDFSAVKRVDAAALRALEEFARIADEKEIKIVIRAAGVEVYKVLKLVKLAGRFSFVN